MMKSNEQWVSENVGDSEDHYYALQYLEELWNGRWAEISMALAAQISEVSARKHIDANKKTGCSEHGTLNSSLIKLDSSTHPQLLPTAFQRALMRWQPLSMHNPTICVYLAWNLHLPGMAIKNSHVFRNNAFVIRIPDQKWRQVHVFPCSHKSLVLQVYFTFLLAMSSHRPVLQGCRIGGRQKCAGTHCLLSYWCIWLVIPKHRPYHAITHARV